MTDTDGDSPAEPRNPEPIQDDRDGGEPRPGASRPSPSDRDEVSPADDGAAIDLDSVHDRAS